MLVCDAVLFNKGPPLTVGKDIPIKMSSTEYYFFSFVFRGQIINIRYLDYFDNILSFIKDRILVYHG